jgi:hypothetical protein
MDRLVEATRQRNSLLPGRDERKEKVLDDHGHREAREKEREEAGAAQWSECEALHQDGRDPGRSDRRRRLNRKRQPLLMLEIHRVRSNRHELAMGEVDEAENRENHRQTESEQCIRRTQAERVDDLLDGLLAGRSDDHEAPMPR